MEKTTPLQFFSVRSSPKKLVKLGSDFFLFDKNGISKRTEILIEKYYKRAELKNGKASHLHCHETFFVRGKLFSISANHELRFGPLGDRIEVDACYDGKCIGDFRAMKSYLGGGSNGRWPQIINDDWQIIVLFEEKVDENNQLNYFSVGYYENIFQSSNQMTEQEEMKSIKESTISDADFFKERFSINDLKNHKTTRWSINTMSSGQLAKLSCCFYPDFQRYRFNRYGKITDWQQYLKDAEPFIARNYKNHGPLYTLEYYENGNTDIYFPWNPIDIVSYRH